MLNLSIDDIKEFTNDLVFRRGYKVFKSNKIKDFKVKELNDNGELVYNISAYILGSSSDDQYYTEFFIGELGITKYYCSCPAFFNYDGPCKHIIALLIAFHYNPDEIFKMQKRQIIDQLINNIQSGNKNLTIPRCELLMDLTLCVEDNLDRPRHSLELKIGETQKYVVKNMKNFIYSIIHKEELQFGANFTLKNTYHYFNEEDMQIINIIKELYEFNGLSENQFYNNKSLLFKSKKVYLPQSHSKRILEILKCRNFNLKYLDSEITNAQILNEDLPLEFIVNHVENNIVIKQINDLPIAFTEDGEYFLYNGTIYKPSKTQIELYRGFFNSLHEDKKIIIDKDYINDVGKFIIPAIKNISEDVYIDNELKNNFIDEPLKSEIYFDKRNNTITSTLYFNYGTVKINPLQDNKKVNEKVAIRDLTKENKIIELLKQYGFKENTKEYCIEDEDKLLTFLSEGMDELQKECEIYYSDSFRNIKLYSSSHVKTSLRINDKNLLEFSFNIEGIDNKELKNVFDAVKLKKNYYRLNNGGFVLLNALGIRDLAKTIEYLNIKSKDIGKDSLILPKYNALYLDEKLRNANELSVERNEKFRESINDFREINENDFSVPDDLKTILRDYQKIGFKWFRSLEKFGFGGILADEMGLGKTLQAASFISSKIDEDKNNIFMVICPTSLIYNWESEFEKFTPHLKTTVISGSKDLRERKIGDIHDTNVIITSYPLIRNDFDLYKDITFTACFIDEAQNIKNPSSQSAKSVKNINSKVNFAITGTPLENSLTELWSIFDFIMPGYLFNHSKFSKIYEKPIIKKSDENALKELNRHIKPFILRRLKRDVALELPPKIEHKLIVDLSDEQKKLYASYVATCKEEIEEEISKNGFNKSKLKILSALTRLRQICCEPSIFIENFEGRSSKLEALLEIIENSIEQKHRILIFSQFTSALKVLQDNLNKNNIEHLYLDGQTKSDNRITLVKKFNEGYGDIFLISLKAGGTGLNLTGADTVIHYDPWWNPAVEEQASDRAHRIGQKKTVEVIKIITKGTIEEKIFELQEKKKEIFNNVMNGASEQNFISKMNEEDLKDLFK